MGFLLVLKLEPAERTQEVKKLLYYDFICLAYKGTNSKNKLKHDTEFEYLDGVKKSIETENHFKHSTSISCPDFREFKTPESLKGTRELIENNQVAGILLSAFLMKMEVMELVHGETYKEVLRSIKNPDE